MGSVTPSERLDELESGKNPRLVARMPSGFAVMHEWQHWPGYCLLLASPMAENLNALHGDARSQFLSDMSRLGDAILEATGAARINYSIYGNLDPFLHAHIVPRFADESEPYGTMPPLAVSAAERESANDRYQAEDHDVLRDRIGDHLRSLD